MFSSLKVCHNQGVPELAEVELTSRSIKGLIGSPLTEIRVLDEKLRSFKEESSHLINHPLTDVLRHGKKMGLVFGEDVLAIHLRMTGSVILNRENLKHNRLDLVFGQEHISLIDPRRFATAQLLQVKNWNLPMGPDLFNQKDLAYDKIKTYQSARALKAVYLDQSVIAGVGNYLIDEALFRAKVSPKLSFSLTPTNKRVEILDHLGDLIRSAISFGGMSMKDWTNSNSEKGSMHEKLVCYGRANLPCVVCNTLLIKEKVAGRSSTYCPNCQSLPTT